MAYILTACFFVLFFIFYIGTEIYTMLDIDVWDAVYVITWTLVFMSILARLLAKEQSTLLALVWVGVCLAMAAAGFAAGRLKTKNEGL